jgi:hypothetical protein
MNSVELTAERETEMGNESAYTAPQAGIDGRVPPGIRLGVIRGISYGLLGAPGTFVPQARALGAGVVRVYLYWSQIEPEPGRFSWDAVDALLAQLDGDEEVWVTVSSSSMWGTRRATDFLPPSPARDPGAFAAFVRRLVKHCAGRVTYWQCDNEPSVPILWAGTAADYVAQLKVFAAAVREADPAALVVLGGAPPGALSPREDPEERTVVQRTVFQHIAEHARDDFDVFDVHLYGDPYTIPDQIAACRDLMAAAGYQKPVVAGEYNGPVPFQLPDMFGHLAEVMKATGGFAGAPEGWTSRVADRGKPPPERDAMVALYERMAGLPPKLQMFMRGCPPELEARRHRWNCREIVVRNMLALAGGVRRTLCWNLAPEVPGDIPPYGVMALMFDKFKLMDYAEDGELARRYPAADTLELTARMLRDAAGVHRHEQPGRPDLYVFEVQRHNRPPVLVAWERRDDFTGEDQPPTEFDWPWPAPSAHAIDAFGAPVPTRIDNGRIHLPVSLTPVFADQAPRGD